LNEMLSPEKEIEDLKATVARYFPVYEVRVRPEVLTFFVHVEPATLDNSFDELRRQLIPRGYVPFITRDKGEHIVLIHRKPPAKFVGSQVNVVMLALTIITTVIAGAMLWGAYDAIDMFDIRSIAFGALFFAFPLMLILGIHEMGHFITAKKYQVAASLPFFVPSIPPLGTFGAVISMRDPIPSRKALLDIGISGPLYGLAVAIPVTLIGLFLISRDPRTAVVVGGDAVALPSYLYEFLAMFFPLPADARVHPTAFAGWVGLFVTALNLLPAGQLDGGHVARAVLGDRAKYLSYFTILTMLLLGLFVYESWLIIALFIMFLGARHPPPLNDITKLGLKRKAVGVVAVVVFLAAFVPRPLVIVPENPDFAFEAPTPFTVNVTSGTNTTANFTIANTGNTYAYITVKLRSADIVNLRNANLTVMFLNYAGSGFNETVNSDNFTVLLTLDQSVNVTFSVNSSGSNHVEFMLPVRGDMEFGPTKELEVSIKVT